MKAPREIDSEIETKGVMPVALQRKAIAVTWMTKPLTAVNWPIITILSG